MTDHHHPHQDTPSDNQTSLALEPAPRPHPNSTTHETVASTWPCPFAWSWWGIRLGWQGSHPIHSGPENTTLILGPPRSGKTTGIIAPAITEAPGPVVSTSTKTDVAALTLPWRQQVGRCWYYDPSGTTPPPAGTTPVRWSPIPGCADWATAVNRAHALTGAAATAHGEHAHWIERAEALLAPLFHAADLAGLDMIWPLRWVLRRDLSEALHALTRHHGDELAADTLQGIAETDERERSGIFSTAARILAAYRTPTAINTTTTPNFDPHAFVHSRDTLYLAAPGHLQNQLAPIIICLLDQVRHHTYTRHPTWPPTLFALDETANIAPLPDLPAIVAEGASQGLVTITCLQDLNQARHRWGPQADGFLTLHGIKIALGGIADQNTLRQLSYLAGTQDIAWTTHGEHRQGLLRNPSWNQTVQQRPRIPPEHINTIPKGCAYLAHTNYRPRFINLIRPPAPPAPQPWTWHSIRSALTRILNPSAPSQETR